MVTVSVSETYDLSTKPGKISLVGIHTPTRNLIKKTYPGLCMNYTYFRLKKCDVKMACASVLPADPLQVGVESGDIAPQDMFNPILYKAVTTESLSYLESRLLGLKIGTYAAQDPTVKGESVDAQSDNVLQLSDDFNAYYALLANRDGFAVAHPQRGLEMRSLVPLVYEKLYSYGTNATFANGRNDVTVVRGPGEDGVSLVTTTRNNPSIKGRPHPMPRLNTTYLTADGFTGLGVDGTGALVNNLSDVPEIPLTYVAALVLPPAKLNVLYYRLVVRWYIEFQDVRPISDIVSFGSLSSIGGDLYTSDYEETSKSMEFKLDMVDCLGTDIEKIMEGK